MGYKKVTIVKEYFGHKKKKKKKDAWHKHEHPVIHLDVPLMLQMFEFVQEHCKSESDLHKVIERLCDMCDEEDFLVIKHFDKIVQESESGVVVETSKRFPR